MQSVQAIWKDPRNERSRNIRPPEQAWLVIDRSFLRRLRFGFGLRLGRLFQFGATLRWYIDNRGHLAALEGPQVTDNRPAITHRDVRAVSHHRVLAVSDRAENLAVGHVADTVILQSDDRRQTVLFGDACARRGRAMTHRASDVEALPSALDQIGRNRNRNSRAPMIAHFPGVGIIGADAEGEPLLRASR